MHAPQGTLPSLAASADEHTHHPPWPQATARHGDSQPLVNWTPFDEVQMSVQGLYQSVQRSLRVRQEQGRQVQTEWDLRLKTVSFEGDELEPVIRKTELSRRSNRIMDPAAHIAPPVMELAQSGRFDLAESFLAQYARSSDDFTLYKVIDYYIAENAFYDAWTTASITPRAKSPTTKPDSIRKEIKTRLQWIDSHLSRRRQPALVVMNGLPGTGKSTVAAEVANILKGVRISSDQIRSRLLESAPQHLRHSKQRTYSEGLTERVYAGLLDRARPVLQSRRTVILDATYGRRSDRQAGQKLGSFFGVPTVLIRVECPESIAMQRLRSRLKDAGRTSDAGPLAYARLKEREEPAREWPREFFLRVSPESKE